MIFALAAQIKFSMNRYFRLKFRIIFSLKKDAEDWKAGMAVLINNSFKTQDSSNCNGISTNTKVRF